MPELSKLEKQLESATREVRSWPKWMQDVIASERQAQRSSRAGLMGKPCQPEAASRAASEGMRVD